MITPTTKEVSDNIIAQLQISFNQTIPLLPKSFLRVLAKVLAGLFIILYKYSGFSFLQIFVATASSRSTEINGKRLIPLVEWGRLIGVGDPVSATRAELLIDITVENQVGTLAAGTQLLNVDNGVTYLTIEVIVLDAPIKQTTIRASSDQQGGNGLGSIGNLEPGAIVSFANPIANVSRDAVVDSQVVTGADAESTEAYRQRVKDRFQKRPQGGAYADYELWGEEVAGIINVYPYTSDNPGQVDVYVEATPESSGNPDGIPTTPQLQAVLDSIDFDQNGLATRRPANALANTFPIFRTGFDITVTTLDVDNEAQVQLDITSAVEEYFLDRAPFIVGLSILPKKDRVSRTALGGIVDEVVSAAGGTFGTAFIELDEAPIDTYLLDIGEKVKASTVTFI